MKLVKFVNCERHLEDDRAETFIKETKEGPFRRTKEISKCYSVLIKNLWF